jgi:uncharacterized phage protein (predicted DNA packaging)
MEQLLSELKQYLNIELDYADDDNLLLSLLHTAQKAIQNYCRGGIDDIISITDWFNNTEYNPLKMAIIQYAAHLYLNRNIVTFQQGYELPITFKFMLTPYLKL